MEPYPEGSDRVQGLAKVTEMGIAFLPFAGSALQVAFNELAGRRLAERRIRWLNDLSQKVHRLEERIGNFAHLVSQDAFMDALTTAAQIADRTSRIEKLQALSNAVINSVMPNAPDIDMQQVLFELIDRFTPTHIRMLTLISDPSGWFERQGIHPPATSARRAVIECGMPELAGREELIGQYEAGLNAADLIERVYAMRKHHDRWASGTTSLGTKLLDFIADPPGESA